MRNISMENSVDIYTDDNAGLMATLTLRKTFEFEREANTFDEYTQKVTIFSYTGWSLFRLVIVAAGRSLDDLTKHET